MPYEIQRYERDRKTLLAPPELARVHPLGKSPVVTDDGETIAESAVILEYLVEKYGNGRLVPKAGTPEYRRYRYFMHYAEGSLMPFLLLRLITHRIGKAPLVVRPIAKAIAGKVEAAFVAPNLARHVGFLDTELGKAPYFAGNELSVADIQMSYPMEVIAARMPDPPPRITEFVQRIRERAAFKRAIERGGPYTV